MVTGPEAARYSPITELIAANLHPSIHFSNRQRVEVHSRIVQPLLDLTLIMFGLPIVICRGERNIFFAAGVCMIAIIALMLGTMVAHALGGIRMLNPPALAAWLPLIVFTPLAFALQQRLRR